MNTNSPSEGEFAQRETQTKPIVPKSASEALRPEAGTPPPRRSRQSRNQFVVFLNFMMSTLVLVTLAAGIAVYFGKRALDAPGPSQTVSTFLVKPNTGVTEISDQLQRRGLISDARIFQLGLRAYGNEGKMKAGEYEVKAAASMRD
ncbi:4-amino-4-deoxychorismate lyase, partial [Rhizobiaceae sp. 2RAB30]